MTPAVLAYLTRRVMPTVWIGTDCPLPKCTASGHLHCHIRPGADLRDDDALLRLAEETARLNNPLLAAQTLFGGTR